MKEENKESWWEEEFDEKFPDILGSDPEGGAFSHDTIDLKPSVKSFISKVEERAKREERERILRFLPEERNGLTYLDNQVREFAKQLRELIELQALKGEEAIKTGYIGELAGYRIHGKTFDTEGNEIEETHEKDCACCKLLGFKGEEIK